MSKIIRYRGDTTPIDITVKDPKTKKEVDITGATFLLTVNSLENPPDDTTQLFQSTGTIVDDPVNGQVTFPIDAPAGDQTPADYYYDIQMTSPSGVKTIVKDVYKVIQDVTK